MGSLEVLLSRWPNYKDVVKAKVCLRGSGALGCLTADGTLRVAMLGTGSCEQLLNGVFTDFFWEDMISSPADGSKLRLLCVSVHNDLAVYELNAHTFSIISQCSEDDLRTQVALKDLCLPSALSLQLLSFASKHAFVLLNSCILVQIFFSTSTHLEILGFYNLNLAPDASAKIVDSQICKGILLLLDKAGLIYLYSTTDGKHLASVNLVLSRINPEEDEYKLSSFMLLRVSHSLITVAAITCCGFAVSVNLNKYFREHPQDLLCRHVQEQLPLKRDIALDEDSLESTTYSEIALGLPFKTERSWEARLSTLCSKVAPAPVCTTKVFTPWYHHLPYIHLRETINPTRTSSFASFLKTFICVQSHGGQNPTGEFSDMANSQSLSVMHFKDYKEHTPIAVSASEFSVFVLFISNDKSRVTVAVWDLLANEVAYHPLGDYCVTVESSEEEQLCIILKESGLSMILFGLTQEELLNRLIIYGSAGTVDSLCHLNGWGRCSIPIPALEAGLKNRQLDTVDFFLKSKKNILSTSVTYSVPESSLNSSYVQLENVKSLTPALNLLSSAIKDNDSEAQSKQFSEQLLNITLSFLNKQVREIIEKTQELDDHMQQCIDILSSYISDLRTFMKKFPRFSSGEPGVCDSDDGENLITQCNQRWKSLPLHDFIQDAIMSNQIPLAQAYLRHHHDPAHCLDKLLKIGLNLVFEHLQQRKVTEAGRLLRNMGYDVNKELHTICFYTDDKDLRDFLAEHLQKQNHFSETESSLLEFIKIVERQLLPSPRAKSTQVVCGTGSLQMEQIDSKHEAVLEKLLIDETPIQTNCSSILLDWAKWWDKNIQEVILLSRQIEEDKCPAGDSHGLGMETHITEVLWGYLTSLHIWQNIRMWLDFFGVPESIVSQKWPALSPVVINSFTHCCSYMKNKVLDKLAKNKIFVTSDLDDFEQLLGRLCHAGGVMQDSLPVPNYLLSNGMDFHSHFITFCLENGLRYLLYVYLEYYRLNLSNCPILADEVLYVAHPWFELLVRFQEITKSPKDPYVIFQSSLTNAHILIPGSQASVSSMLLEGHTLLALATLMFAPGGFDEVVGQKDGDESSWKVDPQLLKMALAPYPKLKSALFPQNSFRGIPAPDISIYNLIQALFPFNPSRHFGWQTSNTLATIGMYACQNLLETSGEMPHFASIDLVNKHAVAERLDYLHYLHHGRPSFAFGTFLVQQLSKTNSAIQAIKQASCEAYGLGLLNFDQPVIAAACVCFCELLGVDSLKLRVDLQVGNLIFKHWTNSNEAAPQNSLRDGLAEKLFKLVDAEKQSAEELLTLLEEAIQNRIERSQSSRTSYQSSLEWALAVQFCRVHELTLSTVYLQHCAWDNEFLQFLIFIQIHNYDSEQVKSLLKYFSPVLQEHLSLAFENLQLVPLEEEEKKCPQDTDALKMSLPRRKAVPHELFHVLLLSQDKPRPWRYLLCEAISHNCPVLSVLAACEQGADVLQCLCVWILTSVDEHVMQEATCHVKESMDQHAWDLHDLSVIFKVLLKNLQVKPLLRGFKLFQKESPMVFMLEMYEQCSKYKDYTSAKCKLFEFQKCLINLKSQNSEISFPIPVQWLESHALLLPFLILQQCQTQYELRKVLQLLADTDSVWRCHGPDFKKLSILSQILQDTTILIDLSLPKNYSTEALQKECQKILEQLLDAGLFALAGQVADLADLPVDRLVINQLLQELQTLKERKQWERRETRISFWKKCNSQFQSDSVQIVSVTEFFMAQAEAIPQDKGSLSEVQLTNIQEKRLLLTLAGHWLSQQDPTPIGQLEAIEKKIWECCIFQQTLLNKFEPANIFFHHVVVAGDSSYDTLIKEFSFSKLTVLNCPKYLQVEGLPVMDSSESKLDTTEKQALAHLIGQLLDEGSIHEASRICRYFDFYNQDVTLVLYCRALASGEVETTAMHPGVQIILTAGCTAGLEKGTRRSRMSSTTSLTSSSSFVVVSQPEDQVISDLQILTDECHHGNNYCRQVLSLYELSKELNCSYSEISAQEPKTVLRKVLSSAQPDRFKKAKAFITIQGMGVQSVAELVASDVLQALLASNQDLDSAASHKPIYNPEDGREVFLQLARLSQDPNIVGSMLLDKISCVPHGELACTVELLILAHDCYTMTCNMEGIVRVLQAARHLSHNHLAPSEQYSLMVRLLTGIGRYNDMTYIFDLLYQNHRFEILLRKKVPSNTTLKTALLDYIKRCHPGDSEKHNMVALCFSMCREIGENHEGAARTQLKLIESQPWAVTPELKKSLMKVLTLLKDAAESYSKDSCVRQALRCIRLAKLVTLQIHFLNINQDRRLINLARQDLMDAMISLPHFYQALVVAEAYDFVPDWAEILFQQVVVRGDFSYLEEFKQQRPLQASLLEDISKKFKQPAESTTGQNLIRLLKSCDDVYMRYKVAYEHKLFGVANALLQDPKTSCYLNDKLAS
ncbi:spatacsin isoform X1 [Erpetoichthys calabaricus]|uniref:spatacsin isoform X1 n=1 Tax=Erpetoichthys calabaricus TaxID=27687 RepID=UPI002233E45D|nr:spatacsin isoform X1 [Erpetoichthys calabaricus]